MARDTRSDARVASEGPSPTMKGTFFSVPREAPTDPGMARDRPSPYGAGWRFFPLREAWRGTGPRPTSTKTVFSLTTSIDAP